MISLSVKLGSNILASTHRNDMLKLVLGTFCNTGTIGELLKRYGCARTDPHLLKFG